MSTIGWIIVAAAIAVVVIVAILVIARISSSRRSSHLQEQFGPEYDRTVDASDSRRAAEQDLAERERAAFEAGPEAALERRTRAVHGRVVGRAAAVSRRSGGSRLAGRASRPPRHGRARLPAGQRDDRSRRDRVGRPSRRRRALPPRSRDARRPRRRAGRADGEPPRRRWSTSGPCSSRCSRPTASSRLTR